MYAGFANGEILPPYVVYKSTHMWDQWCIGGPPGARYNCTKSGWFDMACFENWFLETALPILRRKEGRKVIIGDNLGAHISEAVVRKCQEYDISFVFLIPNATHLLQVLY